MLQTLPHLCCPSLDTFQHLNISLVRGPRLHPGLEVPHQCPAGGVVTASALWGHTTGNTREDALGHLGMLVVVLAQHLEGGVSTVKRRSMAFLLK